MKYTRIFLFASPLLLLIPPMINSDNPGWIVLGSFYSLILRRFPWNLAMAGICYSYAQQLGREAFLWSGFSFFFPFATPLVLAFMRPKYNSTADVIQRMHAVPAKAKATAGLFSDRFPLLSRYLSGRPENLYNEQQPRFDPVPVNYEFLLEVEPSALIRMIAEASNRRFTTWTDAAESGTRFYGAGIVEPKDVEEAATWLKSAAACGGKLSIVWRLPDGVMKSHEYYAA